MYWGDKAYNSLNYKLRKKFNRKVVKLSIDAGFSCPHRDRLTGEGGCIFCSQSGSGDFAGKSDAKISEQLEAQKALVSEKWPDCGYIAYFQAYTNTFAPIEVLREKYYEAINSKDILGIALATRPDCLPDEVLDLLEEINKKTYLWVELGFQTSNEDTAKFINRGYKNSCFFEAVKKLKERKIEVVAHLILGLPGETRDLMLNSVNYINGLKLDGIKLHLLHVLRGTKLENIYYETGFKILSQEEYTDLVCEIIGRLNPETVIHRLTGDGSKSDLIAPLWSLNKRSVLNGIDRKLKSENIWQGKFYQ